jgi:hypothetical protein
VSVDLSNGHPAMDYTEHQKTYAGFLRLLKFAVALAVAVLVGMKIFLV